MTTSDVSPAAVGGGTCPVSHRAASFNPFVEPYLSDPYSFLAGVRAEEPVFYSPEIDYYVVTKFDDVRMVFRDPPHLLRRDRPRAADPLCSPSSIQKVIDVGYVPGAGPRQRGRSDPHEAPEGIGEKFETQRVEALEPRIRAIVTEYLDKFVTTGSADLIDDFVWEIPALVIFMFMGVPDEEAPLVKQFAARRTLFTWGGRPTEDEQNKLVDEVGVYWNYCKAHVGRLLEKPGDDFMSDVIRVHQEDPELIDETYLYNTMLNFLFAGHETTTGASGNGFRALLENRDAWAQLCADPPSLIPNAVEELLRYSSSVIAWRRRAKAATTIGGEVDIPPEARTCCS